MDTDDTGSARGTVAGRLVMLLQISRDLAFEVDVRLGYNPADPYAVRLTFHLPGDASVTWMLSRELLLDGLSCRSGEGDVVVEPVPGEDLEFPDVRIRLNSPAGTAVLYSPALPLIEFLARTDQVLPMGEEQAMDELEQQLSLILDSLDGRFRNAG
ncbi:SsgA family sporulation/cell division regulator [Streptacidiphilus sp. N1-12]|uniref:SsgA family sporulation/cell division regulator n=2 Tax=Streptacidiphilus alkalitolerans TaxID=3342712 RepID=A0ABV6VA12_9ACTN